MSTGISHPIRFKFWHLCNQKSKVGIAVVQWGKMKFSTMVQNKHLSRMFSHSAQTLRGVYCVVHSKPSYGRKKVKRTWCLGNLTLSLSHATNSTNTQSLISSLFTMLQDKDRGNWLKYCVYSEQGNQFEAQLKRPSDARARLQTAALPLPPPNLPKLCTAKFLPGDCPPTLELSNFTGKNYFTGKMIFYRVTGKKYFYR